jgi:amidase
LNPSARDREEPWSWPAHRVARAIATGVVSSREVVQSCLDRIDAVNPDLNALVEVTAEVALEAAAAADRLVASGVEIGQLHGVPVATKVNSDQKGLATTDGLVALKDDVAPSDSPQVASLRRAGAIMVGRSNSPAFALRWFTDNDVHGRTLNPWNPDRTPGGSAGGAGSALAAGMIPVAQGNDIGGSIRYPAYACGVTGIRPTVGRVPRYFRMPEGQGLSLSSQLMAVDGPLARSIADLRISLRCMSIPDARDPFHVPTEVVRATADRPLRVALVRDVGAATPTPAVDAALDAAAGWLCDAGYVVEAAELPLLGEAFRLWWLLAMEDFRRAMPAVEALGDAAIKQATEHYYAVRGEWFGDEPGLQAYIEGWGKRSRLATDLAQFLEQYPIVLLPVSSEQAFEQDADLAGVESVRRLIEALWPMFAIATLGFPALSVPTGMTDELPVGVQLLGRRFDEASLFDAGEVIESRAGILTPIDPVGPRTSQPASPT